MNVRPDFSATQRPIEAARHTPGFVYTSPEVLAREKERLFLKDWLCVGRVEEIERPGSHEFDRTG